jgi:putative hydrolase of the HAD superfamily
VDDRHSPKSDIVPARRAGLHAVFILKANTRALAHDVIDRDDHGVLHMQASSELLQHR